MLISIFYFCVLETFSFDFPSVLSALVVKYVYLIFVFPKGFWNTELDFAKLIEMCEFG
ncbi:unnamed protein product [Meloidogyne enterolobii]|uniref:Uncharacterized protein n=1 Tax=Meloidogyne enterolobii TaxID=390850 RepID=A0ACB1ATX9_MELEN